MRFMDPERKRSAFTLVELLVVIAIIGILVALLLPAVQAAREAARRMSCKNKLKNIALGALNYHNSYNHFPVSMGVNAGLDPYPAGSGAGWILNTLPFLEEQVLYDRFEEGGAFEGDFSGTLCFLANDIPRGLSSGKNGISVPELMQTQLELLQCPSEPSVLELTSDAASTTGAPWADFQFQFSPSCPLARTSYKGVLGDTFYGVADLSDAALIAAFGHDDSLYPSGVYDDEPPAGTQQRDCHRDTRCRGIFFRQSHNSPVRIASVTDGTSRTLMVGEDIVELNRHSAAFYSNGDFCTCNYPINHGTSESDPGFFRNVLQHEARAFKSRHPGGVQFARADGSVLFVSEAVDDVIYRTHCTRNGEETVSGSL